MSLDSKINGPQDKGEIEELTDRQLDGTHFSSKDIQLYLLRYLERKNLTKAKDVNYNKETGIIQNIPHLFFNEIDRTFYFKKDDKHVSTVKSLPCDKRNKIKTLKIYDD